MNASATKLSPPTSVSEKLAQLMVVRIGSNLPPVRKVEQDAERIRELLQSCPLGGLIVFNGQQSQTPDTLADLQSVSKIPLLISADIERGIGQQLHGPELFPHAMAFDALGADAEQAVEEFARLTAIEALKSGLHITYGPVADVNVDPRNPIIATRAFGNDPQRVAQLVSAYVRGCTTGGILSTAKHFPGHGNTHEDSHHELPTVRASREELDRCELVPFQAAIDAGVPLIMSAHVRYPAYDEAGAPATLSHALLVDVLREHLGFRGAVVSDSLLMEGVKSQCDGEGDLAVRALLAGVDILLDVDDPVETLSALEHAVEDGRLPIERVDEAFNRLWSLKQRMFDNPGPTDNELTSTSTDALVHRVASEAISVLAGETPITKFDPNRDSCAILVRPYQSHLDPPQQPLGAAVTHRAPNCQYFELGPQTEQAEFDRVLAEATKIKQLLIAIIVKPAAWHAFGLLPEQHAFVEKLINQQSCVLASLGTPEALHRYDNAAVKLCTYSDVPASQRALAELLF